MARPLELDSGQPLGLPQAARECTMTVCPPSRPSMSSVAVFAVVPRSPNVERTVPRSASSRWVKRTTLLESSSERAVERLPGRSALSALTTLPSRSLVASIWDRSMIELVVSCGRYPPTYESV